MLVKSPNRRYFHTFVNNYSFNGTWNIWFEDLKNGFYRMGPPNNNNNNNNGWFETGAALILLIVSQKGNFDSSDRRKKFK